MKSLTLQSPSVPPTAGALFFMYCVRAWVFTVAFLMLMAFVGAFHPVIIACTLAVAIMACAQKYKKYTPHHSARTMLLILLCIALILSVFMSPAFFTGRDQGTLAYAAITMAQQQSFSFTTQESSLFFDLYGPGTALNFPGFDYTDNGALQAHFPAPYIVWLATFYALFGAVGFVIAHTLLLFFFLYAFTLLLRMVASQRAALIGTIFITTSFPILWIYKTTLSENFMLAVLWSVITLCVFYHHTLSKNTDVARAPLRKERALFYTLLAATTLLALSRIEGLLFAPLVIATLLAPKNSRAFIARIKFTRLIPFIVGLGAFSAYSVLMSYPFYKNVAKAVIGSASEEPVLTLFLLSSLSSLPLTDTVFYNLSTLSLYGVLPFLICAIAGIAWLVYKKNWIALLPLFIAAPALYYILNAHISSDHPWMLRRYTFALIPLSIFYSTLLFFLWKHTKHATIHVLSPLIPFFVWAIVLYNVNITAPLLSYTDHKNLLLSIAPIAQQTSTRDLILVDRDASGDPWALLSGPLRTHYDRHAVYIFNPADIDRIDRTKFDRIFLLTPQENYSFYADAIGDERLSYITKYMLSTDHLQRRGRTDKRILPGKKYMTTRGALYEINYTHNNTSDNEK